MAHGTHWGRLDLMETPEGHETGLRKIKQYWQRQVLKRLIKMN